MNFTSMDKLINLQHVFIKLAYNTFSWTERNINMLLRELAILGAVFAMAFTTVRIVLLEPFTVHIDLLRCW